MENRENSKCSLTQIVKLWKKTMENVREYKRFRESSVKPISDIAGYTPKF